MQKKNKAAQELGRKGGLARARNKTKEELSAIGKAAIAKRWSKRNQEREGDNPSASSASSEKS